MHPNAIHYERHALVSNPVYVSSSIIYGEIVAVSLQCRKYGKYLLFPSRCLKRGTSVMNRIDLASYTILAMPHPVLTRAL